MVYDLGGTYRVHLSTHEHVEEGGGFGAWKSLGRNGSLSRSPSGFATSEPVKHIRDPSMGNGPGEKIKSCPPGSTCGEIRSMSPFRSLPIREKRLRGILQSEFAHPEVKVWQTNPLARGSLSLYVMFLSWFQCPSNRHTYLHFNVSHGAP